MKNITIYRNSPHCSPEWGCTKMLIFNETENKNHNTRIRSTITISESVAIAIKIQVLKNFLVRVGNGDLEDVFPHLNHLHLKGKGASNCPVQFPFLPEAYRQVWLSTLQNWTIKSEEQQWDRMLISPPWKCFYLWTNLIIECRWTSI